MDTDSPELADRALSFRLPESTIHERLHDIHSDALSRSSHIREANFRSIHVADVERLFRMYDQRFFDDACRRALGRRALTFRLSTRMTRAAGTTTMFRTKSGEARFEIAIGTPLLFDTFRDADREIRVCGLACNDRLKALQRVMEHETIHLVEQLCWGKSDCSTRRFQDIAGRHFLHRAHTHQLVSRREVAARVGIHRGSQVVFTFDGRRLTGRVNRVTKRATVLVEDMAGELFSDGRRYKTYYVPITELELVS